MRPILKWISVAAGVLLLFIMGIAFDVVNGPVIVREYLDHDQPDGLSFSFSRCSESSHSVDTVKSTRWDHGVLTVDAVVTPNCGTAWLLGSYKVVDDDRLVLGYKTIAPGLVACHCDFAVSYEIHGIARREYRIELEEYAFIHKIPAMARMLGYEEEDIVERKEW